MMVLLSALAQAGEIVVVEAAAIGVYTTPRKLAADQLGPGPGWGVRGAIGTPHPMHPSVMDTNLHLDYVAGAMDGAALNQLTIGSITSLPVARGGWGFALETDSGGGWAWTPGLEEGTELQQVDEAHYAWAFGIGGRVLTPSPVSVSYQHLWISVEEPWMFWHQFVHQLTVGAILLPALVPLAVGEFMADTTWPFTLGTMLVTTAGQIAVYSLLDYEQHNWPYDDPAPMRATQHMVSVSASF